MSHHKPHSKPSNGRVDWSDPHLESLLRKTESWKLDNRGAYSPLEVQIHIGWAATTGKPALLVWERDQVMVLETHFPLTQGEHIRVDCHLGDSVRTVWGMVVEGREGNRTEDQANGIYVHWLHLR
jgi:hypothetical protein